MPITTSRSITTKLQRAILVTAALVMAIMAMTAHAQNRPEITILTDSNLAIPLTHIVRQYARDNHVSVNVITRRSDELTQQIRDGLPVDIVLTSHQQTLSDLHQSGLVDLRFGESFLKDSPVIARLKNHNGRIDFDPRFIADYQIFILDPTHDAGSLLAFEAAQSLFNETNSIPATQPNITSLLQALNSDKHLAILPASLVSQHDTLVAIETLPAQESANGAQYRAEVVASEHMRDARSFVDYLNTKDAQEVFNRYGFNS